MNSLDSSSKISKRRNLFLIVAILFSLLTFSFSFRVDSVQWLWAGAPVVAGICLLIALVGWAGWLFNLLRKTK